ncbi:hypothetical protein ACTWQE_29930, partial [Streptomyces sp. 8N706]
MDNVPRSDAHDPQGGPSAPAGSGDARRRTSLEEEVRQLDHALAGIEAERARLLAHRAQLLIQLWQMTPQPIDGSPARSAEGGGPRGRTCGETGPRAVQNLLLALGGVMLAVAVTAFAVVSWGHLGIGGRAAVLGALTLATMVAPALLLRRALVATAEVLGCLGLVLLVLDAYALRRVALPDTGGAAYAAVASAVSAALWAAYGLWLRRPAGSGRPGLRLPLPVAVALAQLPLPLWAVAADGPAFGSGSALLATAVFDLMVALRFRTRGVCRAAAVGGTLTGAMGVLLALRMSVVATTSAGAAQAALLLLVAAAVGVAASWRPLSPAAPVVAAAWPAAVGGLSAVAAVGGVLRTALPDQWGVLGYLLCGALLLGAARALSGRPPLAAGLAGAAALVHAAAAAWTAPAVATAVLAPVSWAGAV